MRNLVIILIIMVFIIVEFAVGYSVRDSGWWSAGATMFLYITLAGAFGGLLYTMRESGLESPHRDPENNHMFNLGWVADCSYGIAGAYVVFLVVPIGLATEASIVDMLQSASVLELIKLLALALVGG